MRTREEHDFGCPDTLEPGIMDLRDGERLIVWAARACVVGYNGRLIEREFVLACGAEQGLRACVAFRCLLTLLALYGRRQLSVGMPGSIGLTLCEQQLLRLFAAAQAGATQLVEGHLAWLIRCNPAARAELVIECVATALRARGHRLRLFTPARPIRFAPLRGVG